MSKEIEQWDEAALRAAEEDAMAASLAKAEMEKEEQQWLLLTPEEREMRRREMWSWLQAGRG